MLLVEHISREKPKTLVFLHGHRVSSWIWQDILDELSKHYHCMIIDLPRCGVNREKEFSIQTFTRSLSKIIQRSVPNRKVHVLGVSVGAQVALQLAFDYSTLVESMVLSGVPMQPQRVGKQHEMAYRLNHSIKNTTLGLRNSMQELGIPVLFEREFTKDTLYSPVEYLYEIEKEMVQFSLPNVKRTFRIPTMLIHGENEKRNIKKSVEPIATYFSYTQRVEINGGKQYWMLSKPEVFTNMVFNWIEKKVTPSEDVDVDDLLRERI